MAQRAGLLGGIPACVPAGNAVLVPVGVVWHRLQSLGGDHQSGGVIGRAPLQRGAGGAHVERGARPSWHVLQEVGTKACLGRGHIHGDRTVPAAYVAEEMAGAAIRARDIGNMRRSE